jgi:hypothetical protein
LSDNPHGGNDKPKAALRLLNMKTSEASSTPSLVLASGLLLVSVLIIVQLKNPQIAFSTAQAGSASAAQVEESQK